MRIYKRTVSQLVNGKYVKKSCFCRRSGCHNPPAPNLKYCKDCLKIERKLPVEHCHKRRVFVMEFLGGIHCSVPGCPINDILMLDIDHVADDGYKEKTQHSVARIRQIRKLCLTNPEEARKRFQVLCSGHNKQKEIFVARGWLWSTEIAAERQKKIDTGQPVALPHIP